VLISSGNKHRKINTENKHRKINTENKHWKRDFKKVALSGEIIL
jgi:hypothetical protein